MAAVNDEIQGSNSVWLRSHGVTLLAVIGGALLAGAAWLWWRYGTAVFAEIAVSALAICF